MVKPLVISISGPTNSGKTTISKLVAKELKAAHVEGDAVRWFMPYLENKIAWPITHDALTELVKVFLKNEVDSIVVDYVLTDDERRQLEKRLQPTDALIVFIVLAPRREKLLADTPDRTLQESWRRRIDEQLALGLHQSEIGLVIDNTDQNPEQTKNQIINYISENYGG
ncbi:MAG TPA: AAA family ATPase [Candidatus Saccharimonadales bacterium]|nr:AAA family ATPase [Candidatus Saccharimonadales bacterium]